MTWPLTLGHEIAGTIAELGDGVKGFAVGDRVAVGWFGGNCNHCDAADGYAAMEQGRAHYRTVLTM